MKLDTLESLHDDDLRAVIARAEALLKAHDTERKEKAMAAARATLAAVGLSLKDLSGKGRKTAKSAVHTKGHTYQHPTNKALVWQGVGKKPGWLVAFEAEGGKPVEIVPANDNTAVSLKKTG